MTVWMKAALLATGALNMFGAALFFPAWESLRVKNGFPTGSDPLYLSIISSWIFLFGICYFWLGISGRNERLFLVIGTAGKTAFVALIVLFTARGELPLMTALSTLPDLGFAALFAYYLISTRSTAARDQRSRMTANPIQ